MAKTVREVLASSSSKKRRKDHGSGTKKYGRHKAHCQRYRIEGRREKNKARKARKVATFLARKAKKKNAGVAQ